MHSSGHRPPAGDDEPRAGDPRGLDAEVLVIELAPIPRSRSRRRQVGTQARRPTALGMEVPHPLPDPHPPPDPPPDPLDPVDEALLETFPASDPPASWAGPDVYGRPRHRSRRRTEKKWPSGPRSKSYVRPFG